MQEFKKEDFIRTGNNSYFGQSYSCYWTEELLHKETGNKAKILLDGNGGLVVEPNTITDRIRNDFRSKDGHTKIIKVKIGGQQCLVVKHPQIEQ